MEHTHNDNTEDDDFLGNNNSSMTKDLIKAQKGFGPALKTSVNPFFKSKYASLEACIEAVIDSLHENGFFMTWRNKTNDNGIEIMCVLMHESGMSVDSGWLFLPASKRDPQGFGSTMTYGRRYTLCAVTGIGQDDDDGNSAAKAAKNDMPLLIKKFESIDSMPDLKNLWGELTTMEKKACAKLKERAKSMLEEKENGN